MNRTRWKIAGAAALLAVFVAAGAVLWRAHRVEVASAREAASASTIPFTQAVVNLSAPNGVELIASPANFTDISVLHGQVFLSGPTELEVYDSDGALQHRYRVGLDLPAAELTGLSAGVVGSTQQAELFIATRGAGLLAFNGHQFRQVRPADAGLTELTSVLALSTGRVLFGATHGLFVYNGRSIEPFDPQLKNAHITALAGVEGDVWIGTLHDGLFHAHGGQLDSLKDSLPDPQVLSLAVSDGAVYAGTPLGVVEFRDGRRNRLLAEGYFATALAADGRCLSVGTEDEGIVDVALETRGCAGRRQSSPSGAIRRIAVLDGERYALASDGVYRYDRAAAAWKTVVQPPPGALTNRNISALAIGRGGALWVGYFDRGLDIAEPDLSRVAHLEDDHLFCINRIVPDPDGSRTAVATANGLVIFDATNKVRQVLGRKDGLMANHVTDVVFRPDGMIVATPAGLTFAGPDGLRSFYAFNGLINNHVYALASSGGRTLVGTLGGISSVENDTVRVSYDTSNSSLKQNWITALTFAGGDWFAGTYGTGVFRMDAAGKWRAFPDLKDGFIVNANAMIATASHIYAGSLGRGLYVYDRASGRWTRFTSGLPSWNVTALAEANGYIYAGTDNSLVRIREGALQ